MKPTILFDKSVSIATQKRILGTANGLDWARHPKNSALILAKEWECVVKLQAIDLNSLELTFTYVGI